MTGGDRTQDARDHDDRALIEDAEAGSGQGQGSTAGGDLARDIATQDELARATDPDAGTTRVEGSDTPDRDPAGGGNSGGAQADDRR